MKFYVISNLKISVFDFFSIINKLGAVIITDLKVKSARTKSRLHRKSIGVRFQSCIDVGQYCISEE